MIGASKIARDISSQKMTERRLKTINELAVSINANLDVDTILQLVTDASTKICGAAFGAFFYNKLDEKGKAYMLYALSGAPREAFDRFGMPRATAVFGPTFEGSTVLRSDDITKDSRYGNNPPHQGMPVGHLPVVSYLAVPVKSPKGVVIGGLFLGHPERAIFSADDEPLIRTIAAQAAIALNNAKLVGELRLSSERKDQFIGFASHELKTPLTSLKGYLDLLREKHIEIQHFPSPADRQVSRLESIINDLWDISRIQAGRLDLSFERISLSKIIKSSTELVECKSHRILIKYPEDDITVEVDGQKISQVLVNWVSNAIKYSAANTTMEISGGVTGDDA